MMLKANMDFPDAMGCILPMTMASPGIAERVDWRELAENKKPSHGRLRLRYTQKELVFLLTAIRS
jgi:hypothetical protein